MIRPLTCPVCGKKLPINAGDESDTFPFCSERCRRVDFFRWSDGKYAIVEDAGLDEIGRDGDWLDEMP